MVLPNNSKEFCWDVRVYFEPYNFSKMLFTSESRKYCLCQDRWRYFGTWNIDSWEDSFFTKEMFWVIISWYCEWGSISLFLVNWLSQLTRKRKVCNSEVCMQENMDIVNECFLIEKFCLILNVCLIYEEYPILKVVFVSACCLC